MTYYDDYQDCVSEKAGLSIRIRELQAELAALRPWAEIGKRAVREEWWFLYGDEPQGLDISALLAQLEAEDGD